MTFIQEFLSYYKQHWGIIIFVIPLLVVFGLFAGPLNLLFLPAIFIFLWVKKKNEAAFILFYISLVVGDRVDSIGESITNVRAMLIVFLFFISIYEISKGKYKFDKSILIWIPFFIIAFIGVMRSPIIPRSIMKTTSYFFMLFTAFHTLRYHVIDSKGKILLGIMNTITFSLLLTLILFLVMPSWVMRESEDINDKGLRLTGLMGNANGLGFICGINLMLACYNRYFWKNISVLYTTYVGALSMFLLLFSGSRGCLLAVLLFFFLFFINIQSWIVRSSLKYVIFPLAIYLFITIGLDIIAENEFLATRFRFSKDASVETLTSGRSATWAFLFSLDRISKWREWIWLGRGMGFDGYFFLQLYRKFPTLGRGYFATFNSFVSIIMNNGVIGLSLMMVNIFYYFYQFKDKFMRQSLFIFMFITGMAEAALSSSLNYYTILFFAFLALHIVGHNRNEIQKSNLASIS